MNKRIATSRVFLITVRSILSAQRKCFTEIRYHLYSLTLVQNLAQRGAHIISPLSFSRTSPANPKRKPIFVALLSTAQVLVTQERSRAVAVINSK